MSPSLAPRMPRRSWQRPLRLALLTSATFFVTDATEAQNIAHSTHDWVVPTGFSKVPLNEAWVDVASPGGFAGNRFVYSVGTANVVNSTWAFSNAPVQIPPATAPFNLAPVGSRQVAVLQTVIDTSPAAGRPIAWQRYFFGNTPGVQNRATNARAISVWREATLAASRVAICGETYDQSLALSQDGTGWINANPNAPTGFIAVYDGNGTLLWTHHFFSNASRNDACAITDVSIRVVDGEDVVTYCGISSHGVPGAPSELSPLLPFLSPGAGCNDGAPATPAGQWDGIVGRVVFDGVTSTRTFHSIVGGPGQDGLFGIAEIDDQRFAVAGCAQAAAGASGFPFTTNCGLPGPYAVGTVMIFDATATATNGPLTLTWSDLLGTPGPGLHSIARDVHVGLDVEFVVPGGHMVYVVGSTDDPGFLNNMSLAAPPAQSVLNGPTDGFLVSALDFGLLWTGSFHGGAGNDGLTGVDGWNEFSHHVSVTGFSDDASGILDIDVGTYFLDDGFGTTPPAGSTALPSGTLQLHAIRQTQVGGNLEDRPAVLGATNASTAGLFFDTFGLGQESGGGIAVGPTGRANVVGRTSGGGYPVVNGRGPSVQQDAVRTELDMVPPQPGVAGPGPGRTDGTGFQPAIAFPTPGTNGGTTPVCALAEFGRRVGEPAPSLRRMLIDYQGDLGVGSTDPTILLCNPTRDPGGAAGFTLALVQLAPPPVVPQLLNGLVEIWNDPALPVATLAALTPATGGVFRVPFVPLTQTGFTFSAQVGTLLTNPVGPGGACSSVFTASPAYFFSF